MYPHAAWREGLALLAGGAARPGLTLVVGPPGVGKSLLLEVFADALAAAGRTLRLVRAGEGLGTAALAPGCVLLIDDAGRIDPAELDRIAALLSLPLVLAGPPALADRLGGRPGTSVIRLERLTAPQVAGFVAARQAWAGPSAQAVTPAAVARLAEQSGGLPRRLATLCRIAGALAASEGAGAIEAAHVDRVVGLLGGADEVAPGLPAVALHAALFPRQDSRPEGHGWRRGGMGLPVAITLAVLAVAGGGIGLSLRAGAPVAFAPHFAPPPAAAPLAVAPQAVAPLAAAPASPIPPDSLPASPAPVVAEPAPVVADAPAAPSAPAPAPDPLPVEALPAEPLPAAPGTERLAETSVAAPGVEVARIEPTPLDPAPAPPVAPAAEPAAEAAPVPPSPAPSLALPAEAPPAEPAALPVPPPPAAAPLAAVSLPAGPTLRVTLGYRAGDARAAARAAALAAAWRARGLVVDGPAPARAAAGVSYSYGEDREAAAALASEADPRLSAAPAAPSATNWVPPGAIAVVLPAGDPPPAATVSSTKPSPSTGEPP